MIGNRQECQNPHLVMDGDGGGDPRWNTGPSSLGPNEEQKEEENDEGLRGMLSPTDTRERI